MKSACLTVCIVNVVAFLCLTESKSEELDKTPTAAADPMRGKEPGDVRDDNGLKMKLIWCPPGKFTMGSPKLGHGRSKDEDPADVTLTKGYWLGKFEVTQSEWNQVMKTEPWKEKAFNKEGADYPATFISWKQANDFCRKLTEQERQAGRLSNDWEYTLPTEAQWEWACRARTETKFSFGDDESNLGEHGWFRDNAWNAGEKYAHRVGQKKANPWGLCDMHGNVWEWCRDFYTEKLPGGRDPEVKSDEKAEGSNRVYRGGGWDFVAAGCRSADRRSFQSASRISNDGFRPALGSVRSVQ
jgi:formylglycine-generating enzyme required for sulfatase activity